MSAANKTLVLFDLDGTISVKDTYLAFLLFVLKKRPWRLSRCVFLPFAVLLFKFGLKPNNWLKETFLSAIAGGINKTQLESLVTNYLDWVEGHLLRKEALKRLEQHVAQQHEVVLISASFDFYVEALAQRLGIPSVICTQAAWDSQQRLTGKIAGKNCYGSEKLERLNALYSHTRKDYHVIAFSDHHSDIPLLDWADEAYLVSPTEKLRNARAAQYPVLAW